MLTHNLHPPQYLQQSIKHRNADITSTESSLIQAPIVLIAKYPDVAMLAATRGHLRNTQIGGHSTSAMWGHLIEFATRDGSLHYPRLQKPVCPHTVQNFKSLIYFVKSFTKIHELTSYAVKRLTKSMNLQVMLSKAWQSPWTVVKVLNKSKKWTTRFASEENCKIVSYQQNKLKDTY